LKNEIDDGINANTAAYARFVVKELRDRYPRPIGLADIQEMIELVMLDVLPDWQKDSGGNINQSFAQTKAEAVLPGALAWLLEAGYLVGVDAASYKISNKVFETPDQVASAATPNDPPRVPKRYLVNWHEILDALGLPNNDEKRSLVNRLMDELSGPIVVAGQGSQPRVEKMELLEWWKGLQDRFKELGQRRMDLAATLSAQHDDGREGISTPEISGSVKHRHDSASCNIEKGPKTS